ncbi:RBBP9/YdeN family alpha/beta hydrolase [Streptomyces sp. NPDC057616]|uniref:RBBP9/YdeN family alpha/beta hydrolase n=1 Tax=Streptomyces sp. NPDC057616 TaxID=3346183 RepID=UPI0036ABC715
MTAPNFLVLHGWQNRRPEDHWQHWLTNRLRALGHHVTYPQLPDPDDPGLEAWLTELTRHLDELPGPERVVVAHSASAVLWLHAASRGLVRDGAVSRVLLVAPPSGSVLLSHPEVAEFAPPALDFTLAAPTRLVAGDDDPYCPEGARETYGVPLGLPTDILPGAAHLDLDAGYGSWPSVLAWCLDPTAEIAVRPAP